MPRAWAVWAGVRGMLGTGADRGLDFTRSRRMRIFAAIAISTLVACAAEPLPESQSTQTITTRNKLAANKVTANKLAANKLTANKLAVNMRAAGDLLATPDGREVFSFLVSCALPEDQILVATLPDDTTIEFPGELGLAPSWAHHPLDRVGQGWVSACIFARVNAHGLSIAISLRGPHPALTVGDDERAGWPLEEGAFYGNLFTPDDQPIEWIACRGRDQAAGETGGLVDRDCTEPDPADPTHTQCGFTFAGDCADFAAVPDRFACARFSERGFYVSCEDHAAFVAPSRHDDGDAEDGGSPHDHGDVLRQVITTFTTL